MTTHSVKCWPIYFEYILSGIKSFDIRNGNDRLYRAGDLLQLQEWDPHSREYTGRTLTREIRYVMHGPPFLPDNTWVLGIQEEAR